jgi:hypothetical protein
VRDAVGNIDPENPINKRLSALRAKGPGHTIHGTIVTSRQGGWNLVDLEEEK